MIPIHNDDNQDVTDEAGWPLAWDAADTFFSPGKVEVPFIVVIVIIIVDNVIIIVDIVIIIVDNAL